MSRGRAVFFPKAKNAAVCGFIYDTLLLQLKAKIVSNLLTVRIIRGKYVVLRVFSFCYGVGQSEPVTNK
jgi:hypothetical protein